MTPIKRRLLYIFRDTLLRLRISWNHGETLTLSVGYHIDRTDSKGKQKWDGTRCRINTTHGPDKVPASIINKAIERLEETVEAAFYKFEAADTVPSKQQLKHTIEGRDQDTAIAFFDAYDMFIRDGIENKFWSIGTLKKLKSRKNLLLSFDEKLTFANLDTAKLNQFVEYQTHNCISKEEGKDNYINSTIAKNINLLKWFLRWAEKKGYHVNPDYKSFSPTLKIPQKTIVFLTWEELMRVYSHDFSAQPDLDRVRDAFCLCCFTSLRYSDLANLKRENIIGDSLVLTTVKTADTITIDLNKYSRAILDKYKDYNGKTALPVISNQKMNDKLKIIGKACDIDSSISFTTFVGNRKQTEVKKKYEVLSTHAGRRTFICNALALGIAPNIVMKWTGHSDYNAMKPYIDIADNVRKESMSLFDLQQ